MDKNKEENRTVSSGGVGFIGLLTLLFIALKLTGYIAWSWWWVLSPMIFATGLWILLVVILLIIYVLQD